MEWMRVRPLAVLGVAGLALSACTTAPVAVRALAGAHRGSPASTRQTFADGLHVAFPKDLPGAPPAVCARVPRPAGWARREEARPGSTAWHPPSTPGPVVGYLSSDSVACGDHLAVHLDGPSGRVSLVVYRMGWYGGTGGRAVARLGGVVVSPHLHARAPEHLTSAESWPVAARLPVTRSWTPGLYLLDVVEGQRVDSVVPFVVRDESTDAPTVVMASILTWFAYDSWGGRSLYRGPAPAGQPPRAGRAFRASTARPLAGDGLSQFLLRDLPLVHEIGRLGLDAAYVTDLDVDRRPSLLRGRADLVLPGHSEYWTRRMLDAAEAARDSGTNVAVLGANAVYWQARVSTGRDGTWMTVYRTPGRDPLGGTRLATVQWRSPPVGRSGSQLEGETYTGIASRTGVRVLAAPTWLFAGSGVRAGALVPQLGANEYDGRVAADPTAPPSVQPLLAGAFGDGSTFRPFSTVYWVAPSGAGVFAAGTTAWTCDLDGSCAEGAPSTTARRLVRAVTDNLLTAFAVPRAGRRHPAVDAALPSATAVAAGLPASFVGRQGVDD